MAPSNISDHNKRVILHIDLDCFYAQVEHLRLHIPLAVPLAVRQWNNLIAVNYAARAFGIRRHSSIDEALAKCPQLKLVHVPTYCISDASAIAATAAEEDGFVVDGLTVLPRYHDEEISSFKADGSRIPPPGPDPALNKACLDPYRRASMLIFRMLRAWQPVQDAAVVLEKGGLDEAFLDITDAVEELLIEEFAEKYTMLTEELADAEDALRATTESAPGPASKAESDSVLALFDLKWIDELNWDGRGRPVPLEHEMDTAEEEKTQQPIEQVRNALSRLRIWRGSALAAELRTQLKTELGYIASIGIAPNKMLAKLASAMHKPDQQTWIEPASISTFMRQVPFERIRLMGGKLGRSVLHSSDANSDTEADGDAEELAEEDTPMAGLGSRSVCASDLWGLSVDELAQRVDGDRPTALWVHSLIRGIDTSPVTARSATKSFMSAKSFKPWLKGWDELHDWCVVLVGEIWSRVVEERCAATRWPATMTVLWTRGVPNRSTGERFRHGTLRATCDFPPYMGVSTPPIILESLVKLLRHGTAKDREGTSSSSKIRKTGKTEKTEKAERANASTTPGQVTLFPMPHLAVTVSAFETEGPAGTVGTRATRVDHFFKKIDEGQTAVLPPSKATIFSRTNSAHPPKRTKPSKPTNSTGLLKFFKPQTQPPQTSPPPALDPAAFICEKCRKYRCAADDQRAIQEHIDYHMALDLARE